MAEPKRPNPKGVRYALHLPPKMWAELEAMQLRTGNSIASYIRDAIGARLKADKSKAEKDKAEKDTDATD